MPKLSLTGIFASEVRLCLGLKSTLVIFSSSKAHDLQPKVEDSTRRGGGGGAMTPP